MGAPVPPDRRREYHRVTQPPVTAIDFSRSRRLLKAYARRDLAATNDPGERMVRLRNRTAGDLPLEGLVSLAGRDAGDARRAAMTVPGGRCSSVG